MKVSGWVVGAGGAPTFVSPFLLRRSPIRSSIQASHQALTQKQISLTPWHFLRLLALPHSLPTKGLYVPPSPAYLLPPLRALHHCSIQRRGIRLGLMPFFAPTRGGRQDEVSWGWLVDLWLGGRSFFYYAVCWWREQGRGGGEHPCLGGCERSTSSPPPAFVILVIDHILTRSPHPAYLMDDNDGMLFKGDPSTGARTRWCSTGL